MKEIPNFGKLFHVHVSSQQRNLREICWVPADYSQIYIYIFRCPKLRCCSSITCCAPIQRDDLWWFTIMVLMVLMVTFCWKIMSPVGKFSMNESMYLTKHEGLKAASLVHQMDSHFFCLPNLCYYSPVFFTWIPPKKNILNGWLTVFLQNIRDPSLISPWGNDQVLVGNHGLLGPLFWYTGMFKGQFTRMFFRKLSSNGTSGKCLGLM